MDPVKNFAFAVVQTPPSPETSGNTFTSAVGDTLPDPTSGAYNAVVWPGPGTFPTAANAEIIRITAKSGGVYTIARHQEGSNARQILQGDYVALDLTAKTITDLQNAVWGIANGGTGATTAAAARTALGLAIGSNVEAWSANLDTWSGKTPSSGTPLGSSDTQTVTNKDISSPTNIMPVIGAHVYNSVNQSITSGSEGALSFDIEAWDTAALHDPATNNSRFTIPANQAGKYLIKAQVRFAANANNQRYIYIRKNGATTMSWHTQGPDGAFDTGMETSCIVDAVVGDYFEALVFQNSGGGLNAVAGIGASFFEIHKLL